MRRQLQANAIRVHSAVTSWCSDVAPYCLCMTHKGQCIGSVGMVKLTQMLKTLAALSRPKRPGVGTMYRDGSHARARGWTFAGQYVREAAHARHPHPSNLGHTRHTPHLSTHWVDLGERLAANLL